MCPTLELPIETPAAVRRCEHQGEVAQSVAVLCVKSAATSHASHHVAAPCHGTEWQREQVQPQSTAAAQDMALPGNKRRVRPTGGRSRRGEERKSPMLTRVSTTHMTKCISSARPPGDGAVDRVSTLIDRRSRFETSRYVHRRDRSQPRMTAPVALAMMCVDGVCGRRDARPRRVSTRPLTGISTPSTSTRRSTSQRTR